MFVRITLLDPAAQAHQVELPATEPIRRILPALVRRLRLPQAAAGQPLQYDLYRPGSADPLKPVASLLMAGITHGATLELRAIVMPDAELMDDLKAEEPRFRATSFPPDWRDYQAQIGLGLLLLLALFLWGIYRPSELVVTPALPRPLAVTRVLTSPPEPIAVYRPEQPIVTGPTSSFTAFAALPDGLCFVRAAEQQGTLYCHDAESGQLTALLAFPLQSPAPELLAWQSALYLAQPQNAYAAQIWRSNGWSAGATELLNIPELATTLPLQVGGSYLFGQANVPGDLPALHLYEPGSQSSERLANLSVAPDWYREAVLHNGILYFAGMAEDSRWSLWRSDGSLAGTYMLSATGNAPADLLPFGTQLLFVADAGAGQAIWQTDGTPAGTGVLWSNPYVSAPRKLLAAGNSLFFQADDASAGTQLMQWQAGELVSRLPLHAADVETVALGDTVIVADVDLHGEMMIWRLDGRAGAALLLAADGVVGHRPVSLTSAGSSVYLILGDDRALWRLDNDGRRLEPVAGAPTGLTALYAAGESLYYTATTGRDQQLGYLRGLTPQPLLYD